MGIIFLSNYASAEFAVGFPYRISLHRGETYDGSFSIQNVISPAEDLTIEIVVEKGSEYIQFPQGNTIDIKANQTLNIPVKITAPEKAEGGDIYQTKIIFKPTSGGVQEGGTVNLRFSLGKTFDIEVIGPTKAERLAKIASIVLGIIVLILIIVLLRVIKNKQKR